MGDSSVQFASCEADNTWTDTCSQSALVAERTTWERSIHIKKQGVIGCVSGNGPLRMVLRRVSEMACREEAGPEMSS